jgi:short-chain Z-isoprenyl diphosphate synthase
VSKRRSLEGRGPLYRLYERRLRRSLNLDAMPHHVAIIADGNRRWAKQRLLEGDTHGHRAGAAKIGEFLEWCDELGIGVVTLYLLSTDNLTGRPQGERDELLEIIGELAEELSQRRGWRIEHVGSNRGLPKHLVTVLDTVDRRTADNDGLHVNLAVGYGGRAEITDAVRRIIALHEREGGTIDQLAERLTPDLIGQNLYTGGQPDPDIVIRTSGEQRLSDFMLWQSAYSEIYFVEALYPDLRKVDFLRALRAYSHSERRFGD